MFAWIKRLFSISPKSVAASAMSPNEARTRNVPRPGPWPAPPPAPIIIGIDPGKPGDDMTVDWCIHRPDRPEGCYAVRCQLGKVCKAMEANSKPPPAPRPRQALHPSYPPPKRPPAVTSMTPAPSPADSGPDLTSVFLAASSSPTPCPAPEPYRSGGSGDFGGGGASGSYDSSPPPSSSSDSGSLSGSND